MLWDKKWIQDRLADAVLVAQEQDILLNGLLPPIHNTRESVVHVRCSVFNIVRTLIL